MNMERVRREARTLARCFYFHAGNSNPQKIALYSAILVWVVVALGVMFDLVTIDSPDKVLLWTTLSGAMTYLLGRTHGHEMELDQGPRQ